MNRKLFVGSLPYQTGDDELRELFSQFGAVESASVIRDRATGQSRGFGFVEMASAEDAARAAAQLNNSELNGRRIVVNEARERQSSGPRQFVPRRRSEPRW
jgi:RNA recognition motif-containing protein